MKLVLLGVSGAGKGTQSKNIIKRYNLGHISTGDILRRHIRDGTAIGLKIQDGMDAGQLVDDELMIDIVKDVVTRPEFENGYILDGFPRTLAQAQIFDEFERIDLAVYVQVDDKVVIERLTGRWVCDCCAQMYHINSFPPKAPGICDECGCRLIQREDDKAETVKDRLRIFHELTDSVISYYKELGVLFTVSGEGDADTITNTIIQKLDTLV
ncbi:MAG: nucleoside monophosphate kinase [Defluviitaleaceae bacterium]|nr:nucleoside monophosphate kinase [Defluviitaleaceae bacterium]